MPATDYTWLTDRERAYLDDPDSVDEQTRAEIRYRLRTKYANTVDALSRLHESPELWDTKERAGDGEVTCRNCRAKRTAPRYRYRETGETTIRVDGWHMVRFVQGAGWEGFCDACWHSLRDRESVVEQGRIPCAGYSCDTHTFDSKSLDECVAVGNVAFSTDELDELRDAWRDRRERVCPDCGTPEPEIPEGEIEAGGGFAPTYMTDGLVCDCGWSGFESDLSLVKT